MKGKTCCFVGPRPPFSFWKLDESVSQCEQIKNRLREEIKRMITEFEVCHFICGMDLGVDFWAAEIVLDMKTTYPVTLECAIPHEGQANEWSEESRDRYFSIVQLADYETMLQTRYTPDCFRKCNHYMVDHSQFLITVLSDGSFGSLETIRYARKKGVAVIKIQPTDTQK